MIWKLEFYCCIWQIHKKYYLWSSLALLKMVKISKPPSVNQCASNLEFPPNWKKMNLLEPGESSLLSNKKIFFASSNWFNMGPQSVPDLYKIMSNFETKNTSLCIRNCSILKSRRRSSFFLPHWPLTVHNGLLLPNSKECDVR